MNSGGTSTTALTARGGVALAVYRKRGGVGHHHHVAPGVFGKRLALRNRRKITIRGADGAAGQRLELSTGNGSPVMNDVMFDVYGLSAALGHDSVSEIGAE